MLTLLLGITKYVRSTVLYYLLFNFYTFTCPRRLLKIKQKHIKRKTKQFLFVLKTTTALEIYLVSQNCRNEYPDSEQQFVDHPKILCLVRIHNNPTQQQAWRLFNLYTIYAVRGNSISTTSYMRWKLWMFCVTVCSCALQLSFWVSVLFCPFHVCIPLSCEILFTQQLSLF